MNKLDKKYGLDEVIIKRQYISREKKKVRIKYKKPYKAPKHKKRLVLEDLDKYKL